MIVTVHCLTCCCVLAAGALAEAVAQPPDTQAAAVATTAAGASSRVNSRSSSFARASSSSSRFKPAPLQLLQHQNSDAGALGSPGVLSSSRMSAAAAEGSTHGSWAHSATAAARLARQASNKSAQTGDSLAPTPSKTAAQGVCNFTHAEGDSCQQQQHSLEQELAVANAQLASALATARQVLNELVLGQDPGPDAAQALQNELAGLSLEEALTEVVYQVQEKLVQAAAAAEAATAAAEAATAAAEQQQQRAPLAASSRASSMRLASPQVSVQVLERTASPALLIHT
jgi:hypothetical protein